MSQTNLNVFDNILYYLSHTEKLHWEKFKRTVELLTKDFSAPKPSFYLRSLARLGHLDFEKETLDCVIAPAVLVETAVKNRYVLVGSRTPKFLSEVEKVIASTGGKLNPIPETSAPTTISLSGLTTESLTEIASLGIHIGAAFSAKLSSVLPKPQLISFPIIESQHDVRLEKFDVHNRRYVESCRIEDGLNRVCRWGRDDYVLKLDQHSRRVPRDWGEWLALHAFHKTGLIRYEKKSRAWCVRKGLIVPLLVERCATLCSGRPPESKGGFNHYLDFPIGIAFRLTELLYQRLEVI